MHYEFMDWIFEPKLCRIGRCKLEASYGCEGNHIEAGIPSDTEMKYVLLLTLRKVLITDCQWQKSGKQVF